MNINVCIVSEKKPKGYGKMLKRRKCGRKLQNTKKDFFQICSLILYKSLLH